MANARVKFQLLNCTKIGFQLLEQYSWLLDSYLLDFFTENHMQKLPKSWKEFIDSIPLDEFHGVLNNSVNTHTTVFPLSLICIRILIQYLTLPREVKNSNKFYIAEYINKNKVDISKIFKSGEHEKTSNLFTHPKLWNLFLKHVKPKKRYEILKIAEMTADIAKRLNVQYIVDIGSGLGHLSRVLAYGFNLKVCSVETQSLLIEQAMTLDSEFETTASKYLNSMESEKLKNKSPIHMNKTISSDLDVNEFVKDLKTAFLASKENFKFGIVGLHPCGDLAAVLLKMYSKSSETQFINLVGCCYHKLSTSCNIEDSLGFPLSRFCGISCHALSYEVRALACHAIETYCDRIKLRKYDHLKVHCYRAALEKIIFKNWPHLRKHALSNVKAGPEVNFSMYCEMALKKLGVSVPKEDFHCQETLSNLSQWQDVVKYYSLRLMFAPLIETVILLDRMIYLLEQGVPCQIMPVFDPILSPRNQLLLSEKPLR